MVVVGAGAAGLYTALTAAEAGAAVTLVSSSPLSQSASYRAQGGLAAALAEDDDVDSHLRDTIEAGRGACRPSVAQVLCEEAPERVRELERRGVPFDRAPGGELSLGREGGHGRRRVAHAGGSATGRHVSATLSQAVSQHERIDVRERTSATRLWLDDGRCIGVVTEGGAVAAGATVLATGGAAALWSRTTNPPGATGAGMLLALQAGAALADLELLQFHPTALVATGPEDGFLVTEAVRGEGARLLSHAGERFVDELAPRDEVARAIWEELENSGRDSVLLDMRGVDPARFPNVVEVLGRAGLDPTRDLLPVAPAAHYAIGGVAVDVDGRSTLPGLLAVGECACTGVHGANRLASNSLSECFVFGRRSALVAASAEPPSDLPPPPRPEELPAAGEETRRSLWENVGLVRSMEGLERAADEPHPLARLTARSALARRESRGCHLRSDWAATDPGLDACHYVVSAAQEPRLERWL